MTALSNLKNTDYFYCLSIKALVSFYSKLKELIERTV